MDIHHEAYPIMNTHNWIIDIHNWISCAVRDHSYVFIMDDYMITSPYFCLLYSVFISTLTHCKCSWRRDLLNKAGVFQNDNDKTPCHEACIIRNWYIEYSNADRNYDCCVSAWSCVLCSPHASQWVPHTLWSIADVTWSVVYNTVPQIRLAGSVSMEWFIAINVQITLHPRSDGCHWNIAYITSYISKHGVNTKWAIIWCLWRWPFLAEVYATQLKHFVPSSV